MPRGNLDNFGDKKAHAFGSKEREAKASKAKSSNKKLHSHGMTLKKPKQFNPKKDFVRNSQGDFDRRKATAPGKVNKPAPQKDAYKPMGESHGMQMGSSGYGLTHGSVESHGYGYRHRG